jgi:epoxyqueuosine reductase
MSILKPPSEALAEESTIESKSPSNAGLWPLVQQWAKELGFADVGVAGIDLSHAEPGLLEWLDKGFHGQMHYMARHGLMRARPNELVAGTLSVITAKMNYLPASTLGGDTPWRERERDLLKLSTQGVVSLYARGRDYHKVMRQRLEKLAQKLREHVGELGYRVFTDSAPVLEVELGVQSGLGWRGKHTLLLSKDGGSMFFLGEIYIDFELTPTTPVQSHCGSCSACMDVCPTQAITAPYQLDARRCISYLTIEHPGSIPIELRSLIGNHIYGCDDCQTICPWNKYAQPAVVADFDVRATWTGPSADQTPTSGAYTAGTLVDYFNWSLEEFEHRTAGSAIRRIGHERWLRNIAVAMGNALRQNNSLFRVNTVQVQVDEPVSAQEHSQEHSNMQALLRSALEAKLHHPSAVVVEHVRWALDQGT